MIGEFSDIWKWALTFYRGSSYYVTKISGVFCANIDVVDLEDFGVRIELNLLKPKVSFHQGHEVFSWTKKHMNKKNVLDIVNFNSSF